VLLEAVSPEDAVGAATSVDGLAAPFPSGLLSVLAWAFLSDAPSLSHPLDFEEDFA
jgi:hypothetical protein